ncbi:Peroxidase mlt-7 [Nowakowskiella sp. JEL0407]|nr:Peroxidase mlt-7 [Nowakowskiella sp. JEL0407]
MNPLGKLVEIRGLIEALLLISFVVSSNAGPSIDEIQTFNGTWNNMRNIELGSVGDLYSRRLVRPNSTFANKSSTINPRFISNHLFNSMGGVFSKYNNLSVNELLPAWGFMLHMDITALDRNREHNRRARNLKAQNPTWTSDMIFNRARRWVIAVVQKITLYQYFPMITGEAPPLYAGYNASVDPRIDLFFSNVAMRYGHSALNPVMLRLNENGEHIPQGPVLLRDMLWTKAIDAIIKVGIEPYIRGMMVQSDQEIDPYFADVMRDLPLALPNGFDLAAIGIQRGRDLLFPSYNECRESLGLPKAKTWNDITNNTNIIDKLSFIYQNIDDVECYAGAFSEDHSSYVLGPMMRTAIRDQLLRLRDGDRWWYENSGVLLQSELQEMTSMSFGKLITLNTNITSLPYTDNPMVAVSSFNSPFKQSDTPKSVDRSIFLGEVYLRWSFLDNNYVSFQIETNQTGWFGIGFGENMLNATIFLVTNQYSRNWTVHACRSLTLEVPRPNLPNMVENVKEVSDSISSFQGFTFQVKLGNAFSLSNQQSVIAAWSSSYILKYHGPGHRVRGFVDFQSSLVTVKIVNTNNVKTVHGLVMGLSVGVLLPLGIFVARYYQGLSTWLTIHETLMTTVATNIVVAAVTAVVTEIGNLDLTHCKYGFVVTFWTAACYFSGRMCAKWKPGNATLGVMDITAGTTLENYMYIVFVVLSVFFGSIVLGIGEYYKRLKDKKSKMKSLLNESSSSADVNPSAKMNWQNLPDFDWDEINERVAQGYKWIIIDTVIYDVSQYAYSHPGGPRPINIMIGLDATQNYHGRKPVQELTPKNRKSFLKANNSSTSKSTASSNTDSYHQQNEETDITYHNHSRLAHFILADLAIGRVRLSYNIELDIKEKRAFKVQHSTNNALSLLKSSSFNRTHSSRSSVIVKQQLSRPQSENGDVHFEKNSESYLLKKREKLTQREYRTFVIVGKETLTPLDATMPVLLVTIRLPDPLSEVNVLPGQVMYFQFVDEVSGEVCSRPYNPIHTSSIGSMQYLVKIYPSGLMSNHISSSSTIRMRGPITSNPSMLNNLSDNKCWKELGMIAFGTGNFEPRSNFFKNKAQIVDSKGIAPMLCLIDFHIKNARKDYRTGIPDVRMHLLHVNTTDKDAFYIKQLKNLEQLSMGTLVVHHLVNTVLSPEDWKELTGDVTEEVISATMPFPAFRNISVRNNVSIFVQSPINSPSVVPQYSTGRDISSRSVTSNQSEPNTRKTSTPHTTVNLGFTQTISDVSVEHAITPLSELDESTRSVNDDDPMSFRMIICGPKVMTTKVGHLLCTMGYPGDVVILL